MAARLDITAVAERLEETEALDAPAHALESASDQIPDGAHDVLTGAAFGSPLHPALVHLPIGASISALAVSVLGGQSQDRSARLLAGLTSVAAVPAALTGLADFGGIEEKGPSRLGAAHALVNAAGTTLAALAALSGPTARRFLLAGSVAAYLAGGYLGGHLVYGDADEGSED